MQFQPTNLPGLKSGISHLCAVALGSARPARLQYRMSAAERQLHLHPRPVAPSQREIIVSLAPEADRGKMLL